MTNYEHKYEETLAAVGPYHDPYFTALGSILDFSPHIRADDYRCDTTELGYRLAAIDRLAETLATERHAAIREHIEQTDTTPAELARTLGISRQAATRTWGPHIRRRDRERARLDLVPGDQALPLD